MATIIKIVYDVTNPVIKVTYDVTNITVSGSDIAPVYISLDYSSSSAVTVITSVGLTMPTGFSVANSPLTSSGTLGVTYAAGYSLPTTTKQGEWDQAYNDKINSASVTGTTTKTLTLNQQDGGTIQASWSDIDTGLTSVGVSMPSGFTVANSPLTSNGTINITGSGTTAQYLRGDGTLATFPTIYNGTVTSVDMTVPTGLTISGNPITSAGTLALALASGYSIPTTASQATWDTAYNDSIVSAAVTGTTTKTLTLNQQDGGSVTASWSDLNTDAVTSVFGRTGAVVATEGDYTLTQLGDVTLTSPTNGQVLKYNGTTWVNNTDTDTGLTSVGLSMPSAFSVSNSPLTSNGTLAVTGAGTAAQYVRGDGQLATLPTSGSGGSSVSYYLNGGTAASVGTYYQMSTTSVVGANADFTRTGNGLISQFLTDAGDPNRLQIPAGNWNFEMFFSMSSNGGTPEFYVELLKYDGTTFTSIASSSAIPEVISGGTIIDLYLTALAIPATTLLATDRLALRVYIVNNSGGRTATLHTQDSHLCQIITNFAGGVSALNGLTANTQYFATGTSGTDFAISSATDTHTFNLPIASGTNTGKLSNTDWTTFINKQSAITLTTFNASGSATFVSSVLNIPTYTLVGLGGEPAITAGATTQYFRGDKTFQTLDTSVVPENSNLYYTDTRARNAITLTTTGSSGASTYSGGTLNIPIYSLSGLGGVPTTRTLTINGTTYDLSADRSWTIPVHDAVTIGTANGLSLSTQVLSLGLASSSANGALSSTDWTTFNGKQNAITLTTTGTSGAATLVGATLNIPNYGSALSGYLPLTGGTLTGTLSGTSATFNGVITTNNDINLTSSSYIYSSAGGSGVRSGMFLNGATQEINFITAATIGLTIASTGAATFSSTVTATSLIKSGGTSSQFLKADGSVDSTTYQSALTLTTTGSSGASTLIGSTLNIPSYSVAGLGAVPDSRTITINGEVFDLSANRTFEVGNYGTF